MKSSHRYGDSELWTAEAVSQLKRFYPGQYEARHVRGGLFRVSKVKRVDIKSQMKSKSRT